MHKITNILFFVNLLLISFFTSFLTNYGSLLDCLTKPPTDLFLTEKGINQSYKMCARLISKENL